MEFFIHRVKHPKVRLKKSIAVAVDYQNASYRAFTLTDPKIYGVSPTVSGAIKALENKLPALFIALSEEPKLSTKTKRILTILEEHLERV